MSGEDKKAILAFLFIGLIIFLWPIYMQKVAGIKETKSEATKPLHDSTTLSTIPDTIKKELYEELQFRPPVVKADTFLIETDLYQGKITTMGGGTLINWKLKKYFGPERQWVKLVSDSAKGNLGIRLGAFDFSNEIFNVVLDSQWVNPQGTFRKIRFRKKLPDLGEIEKEFLFVPGKYDFTCTIRWKLAHSGYLADVYFLQWASGLLPTEQSIKEESNFYEAVAAYQGGGLLKTKLDSTGFREGYTQWVAVRTKYFLVALIPKGFLGQGAELKAKKYRLNAHVWKTFTTGLAVPIERKTEFSHEFLVYLGPMDYQIVKSYEVHLEHIMNLGWKFLRPISIGLLYVLQALYRIVHNYGWVLVIFAFLIKLILYPLTRSSMKSMKQMQELQPKINALREKYKNDPQRLNVELMKLYKQQGINPMGGCLPLLLQLPILIALFNLFRTTIILRQASFLGIIQDLSMPDRIIPLGGSHALNLLPILMGITMFLQQRKTVAQDPRQKFMAYFMSIFMVYIFYNLSAGLNLYYLTFNVLSIFQDEWVKRSGAKKE